MRNLKRVTRADVAKEAGVTETIVSYVINNNRYVDKEKRLSVEKAIKKLHYHPNFAARALKGKKTDHILVVADDIMSDHFGKIISEMEKIAYDRNCFISLCSSRNDEQFINLVYEHFFDGILIGSITLSEENIQRLVDTGIPIVLLENRDYSMITGIYGKIDTGIYTGARQCVKALYEKGRRNLLYVDRMDTESGQPVHIDYRYNGFFDQLKEYNIKHNISQVVYGYKSEDELRRKLFQYIKDEQKVPDGIMCFTDDVACMVMEIVKDMGYHIPLDISIIGFNNSKIGRYTSPTLSSVEIPRGEIGKSAMKILTELIDHKEDVISPIVEKLKTRLVIRESI